MSTRRSSTGILVGVVTAIVVAAAIVAVVVSRGKDSTNDVKVSAAGGATTVAGASGSTAPATSVVWSTVAPNPGTGSGAAGEVQPVTSTGTALADLPDSGTDPAIGKPAPALAGSSFDGSAVTVTPGHDGPMLLLFVAHWCPHCQREVPRVVKWVAAGSAPKNLRIVAVSTGQKESNGNWPPSAWLTRENWTLPVLVDSAARDAAVAYGLSGYPYFVIVKADGTVGYRGAGEVEMTVLSSTLTKVLGS
jgi:thiol-disulfide isomerase/thioredoxin